MAYSKHEWNAGEAITAPKMNTLETAVQDVAALADKLLTDTSKDTNKNSLQKQIDDANSSITTVSTWIDGTGNRLRAEVEDSGGLMAQVAGLQTSTENGDAAWQQVAQVITRDSQGNVQTSLKKVVDDIKTDITAVNNTIGAGYSADNTISAAISTEITARRSNDDAIRELITNAATGQESFYGSEAPTTLQQRVADLMTGIDRKANQSALSTATTAIGNQAKDITNIQSEIKAAHRSENDTLDARLDDIEAAATTAATTAAQYNDETYVKKSQIIDSLDIDTSGNVLDARQGKNLNTHITKIETALDGFINTKTVQSEIDDTESALIKWVNGKIVDSTTINTVINPSDSTNITSAKVGKELYSELSNARISQAIRTPGQNEGDPDTDTTYNSLDERLEAIEGRANTASNAFEQLQTEILAAHESNVKGTEDKETHEITPLEYGSLDARFEAAEGDIHKIASELKMYNQAGAIQDATTRIDTIEKNVLEMGKEIGMINDLETVQTLSDTIDRASTRIDNIKSEIGAAHRTNEDTLNARFGAVESSVSNLNSTITNAETGLAKTKEIADEALGKANAAAVATEVTSALAGKASTESVGELSNRVTTLEQSGTVVIDNVTYDNDGNPSDIGTTPSPDIDYLLKKGNKYYYWKYIPNNDTPVTYTWALISGSSDNGGSGNTTGIDLTEDEYNIIKANKTYTVNTDYYVLQSDNIRHHYRYIQVQQDEAIILQEIEIGQIIDINNIKTYNVEKFTANDKTYLRLFEYDYNEENEIDSSLMADVPEWENNIHYNEQQYVLRDGYAYRCIVSNDDTDWVDNHWEKLNIRVVNTIELPEGGGGESSNSKTYLVPLQPRSQILSKDEVPDRILLQFVYQSYTSDEATITEQSARYTLTKGNRVIATDSVESVSASIVPEDLSKAMPNLIFDVTDYCEDNIVNNFQLVVVNANNVRKTYNPSIEIVTLTLKSNFSDQQAYNYGTPINIQTSVTGPSSTAKTMYVTVDTNEPIIYNNIPDSQNILLSNLSVGTHTIQIYFEQYIGANQEPSPSNILYYDIIVKDEQNDNQIYLSSADKIKELKVKQYETLHIPYYLYVPNNGSTNLQIVDTNIDSNTIELHETGPQEYIFKAYNLEGSQQEDIITITSVDDSNVSLTFKITVTKNAYTINQITQGLVFDFNPLGYSNEVINDEDKYWKNVIGSQSNIQMSVPEGKTFDWANGGWKYDSEHEAPYFCVKAGSRIQLNYTLFPNNIETHGSEFKCIFKTTAVRDPEAVFLTSLDKVTRTITQYESNIALDDQDTEKSSTLFSSYLSVKEGIVTTFDKDGEVVSEKVVLVDIPKNGIATANSEYLIYSNNFDSQLQSAQDKIVQKNTTKYIQNNILNADYVKEYFATNTDEANAIQEYLTADSLSKDNISITETWLSNKKNEEGATLACQAFIDSLLSNEIKQLKKNYKYTYAHETRYNIGNFTAQELNASGEKNSLMGLETRRITVTKEDEVKQYELDIAYTDDAYNQISIVRPISAIIDYPAGLEMRAHRANIYLNSGTLTYPYSEEDIIEFEYNIHAPIEKKSNSYIAMYEDGVPSAAMLYTTGQGNLNQTDAGNIIVGSDDCDVWIYRMKFYNTELTNQNILTNFYADALSPDLMISRYETNSRTYINPLDPDTITPQSIAEACPDLRVIMIEAPNLTQGKNSFIKHTKIRCIYKNGRPEDNWVVFNAYHAGQGTSSDAYGASGRNLDIIFGFDGVNQLIAPKAKNNYRFDPSYTSTLITGVVNTNNEVGELSNYIDTMANEANTDADTVNNIIDTEKKYSINNWHLYSQGTGKISLSSTSVPNAWFNIKLNIASSENTNNALLQKRFDRYLRAQYLTPAQKRTENSGILTKNDMEFFNTIVFIKETGTPLEFTDDKTANGGNSSWHFYGIGNLGDSKKTDDTRINIPGDPNEFCVEVSDNGLLLSGFRSGVYYTDAEHTSTTYQHAADLDIKYPISEEEWDNENNAVRNALIDLEEDGGWEQSLEFRYDISTKDGNTIADGDVEEALAKERQDNNKEMFNAMYKWVVTTQNFEQELDQWFIKTSPLYFYLFTERYTMIDNRAKNTFYHYGKVYITEAERDGTNIEALQTRLSELQNAEKPDEKAIAIAKTELETAQYIYNNSDCFIVDNDAADINNGYRFDLWGYDMDTALGINNNGKMVFEAGLEDVDRTANAWVYNEATNVFWQRIRACESSLRTVYGPLKQECFNAENLIEEFDKWQQQFPENLWRMDFERKYYRPYKNSNEVRYLRDMANGRKKYQRREFERNMAIYVDSKYRPLEGYDTQDFIQFRPTNAQNSNQNTKVKITLYSPMYINYSIGNQDTNATIASGHTRGKAGETYIFDFSEGITAMQNIQSRIFNASCIKAIEGLENYYADDIGLSTAKKLRYISLGSDYVYSDTEKQNIVQENGTNLVYINTNTKTLSFGEGNPVLETIDLTNCRALASELTLKDCTSLTTLIATGTSITTPIFADNGLLTTIKLPSSITKLKFNNLYLLSKVEAPSYQNLTSFESYNSPNYDSLSIVKASINKLTVLKLNDINWTIGDIDELEQFKQKQLTLGTNMYLAGRIKITGKYSNVELEDYNNFWNHQIKFDVSQGILKIRHRITYKYDSYYNEDTQQTIPESTIKVLYVADTEQVPDIWSYWDTVSQKEIHILQDEDNWTSPPSRASTRSTIYTFGTYTDNKYNQYSGWRYEDATSPIGGPFNATRELTLYTYFKTTERMYTINWYLKSKEENQVITPIDLIKSSSNVKYGEGYDQIAPTVKDIHAKYLSGAITNNTSKITVNGNEATYEIFDGWERLPTNINPTGESDNFNIFAKWKKGTMILNSETFSNTTNLSPEQLLVLSGLSFNERKLYAPNIVTSSLLNYQMGHDYDSSVNFIQNTQRNNSPIWRFDRNDNPMDIQNITPFKNNDGWTLAIDYSFMPDVNYDNPDANFYPNAAVLAGCYDVIQGTGNTNTVIGFALYYNRTASFGPVGPCIGFGDMFNDAGQVVSLGTADQLGERNIVVLRKPKNSSSLFVYSGKTASSSIEPTVIFTEKTWNKLTSNAPLEFGKLKHTSLSQLVTNAKGTIYWAKYWEEDLGVGECLQLASWPHEDITFAIANSNSSATSANRLNPDQVALNLTAISGNNYGLVRQGSAGKTFGDVTGWKTSLARTLCNDRIFAGLPTPLQSIICKAKVGTRNLEVKKDGGGTNYNALTNIDTTNDYIYLPSIVNFTTNSDYQQEGGLYPWMNSAGIVSYTYNTSGQNFTSTTAEAKYRGLRFSGYATPIGTMHILHINGQITGNSTFRDLFLSSPFSSLNSGDIVIDGGIDAYIYVSSNDIINKGLQVESSVGKFATNGTGGWLKAQGYWTRSINYNANTNYYMYIDDSDGSVQSTPPSTGLSLIYSFSV